MSSNHLILCRPLLPPSNFPSIRVCSNESVLHIKWPEYWSFSFNISPSNEHPGLISFRMDWLELLAVQATLKSLLQHHSLKTSILHHSAFFRRKQWHPTLVLLPEKSHGRRSLVGRSPWGHEESDMTEQLHFHFSLSCIGEGNGNPLHCSCLENPRDRGAWWAAIYGVAQSRTRLKRLSSSSSNFVFRVYPYCSMYHHFIAFCYQIIFHRVYIPYAISYLPAHDLTDIWVFTFWLL